MCGRYAIFDLGDLKSRFGVQNQLSDFKPTYNAAPGMQLPVVLKQSPVKVVLMRWGLIPAWAQDPKIGYRMINARAETVDEKPAYKQLLRSQRCIVLANGFYEWQQTTDKKQPYYIKPKNKTGLALAGLWDEWADSEGRALKSFTIVTTKASGNLFGIHERMPASLNKETSGLWLDKEITEVKLLKSLLNRGSETLFETRKVSDKVNRVINDSPDLIKEEKESNA